MKHVVVALALLIAVFGAISIVEPSGLDWIAGQFVTPVAFYIVGVFRAAFGLALISVAAASHAPKTLRALGYFILIAGIATVLTGFAAVERAHALIEWWLRLGSIVGRLAGAVLLAIGGFVVYACVPAHRAA